MKANTWIAKKLFHAYLLGHCCPLCQKIFYQHRPGEESGPPLQDVACEHCGILFRERLGQAREFADLTVDSALGGNVYAGQSTN